MDTEFTGHEWAIAADQIRRSEDRHYAYRLCGCLALSCFLFGSAFVGFDNLLHATQAVLLLLFVLIIVPEGTGFSSMEARQFAIAMLHPRIPANGQADASERIGQLRNLMQDVPTGIVNISLRSRHDLTSHGSEIKSVSTSLHDISKRLQSIPQSLNRVRWHLAAVKALTIVFLLPQTIDALLNSGLDLVELSTGVELNLLMIALAAVPMLCALSILQSRQRALRIELVQGNTLIEVLSAGSEV